MEWPLRIIQVVIFLILLWLFFSVGETFQILEKLRSRKKSKNSLVGRKKGFFELKEVFSVTIAIFKGNCKKSEYSAFVGGIIIGTTITSIYITIESVIVLVFMIVFGLIYGGYRWIQINNEKSKELKALRPQKRG